jgi:oligopeptide transport system permease protein
MLNYTLLRIAGLLGILLIVSALTFGLMHAVPGGPFDARALEKQQIVPENIKRQLNEKYGLDKPVWQQYALFVRNAVFLDFGYSMAYPSRTVIEIFKQQWSYSLQLGLLTFIFSIIVGVGLGIASAIKKFKIRIFGVARLAADRRLEQSASLDNAGSGKFARARFGFAALHAGEYD